VVEPALRELNHSQADALKLGRWKTQPPVNTDGLSAYVLAGGGSQIQLNLFCK